VGPLHAVVAHSLGAAAALIAIPTGLVTRRAALVAPMLAPVGRLGEITASLRVPAAVAARMRARSESRIQWRWDDLRPLLTRDPGAPTLVVHDRHDPEAPVAQGRAIAGAWADASLVETAGLGHNRLLRSPEVVANVVDVVTRGVETCRCGAPVRAGGRCEGCGLEQDLFDRAGRRSHHTPPA
jgi:pimeloyl-ACP methyl ester carboxylesterase